MFSAAAETPAPAPPSLSNGKQTRRGLQEVGAGGQPPRHHRPSDAPRLRARTARHQHHRILLFCFLRHLHFLRNQGRQPLNFLLSTVALFWSASRGQDTIRRERNRWRALPSVWHLRLARNHRRRLYLFQRAHRRRRHRRTRPEPQANSHVAGGPRHAFLFRGVRLHRCRGTLGARRGAFALRRGNAHAGRNLRDSPPQDRRSHQFHGQP